jgi:hypothetical protein
MMVVMYYFSKYTKLRKLKDFEMERKLFPKIPTKVYFHLNLLVTIFDIIILCCLIYFRVYTRVCCLFTHSLFI